MAYPPVVAGGSSATIIHYGNNDKVFPYNFDLKESGTLPIARNITVSATQQGRPHRGAFYDLQDTIMPLRWYLEQSE